MPVSPMNREEFYAKVSPLDAEQLRKALWTLYWRGTAQVRERIEDALDAVAREEAAGEGKGSRWRSWGLSDGDYTRKERAGTFAVWHAHAGRASGGHR